MTILSHCSSVIDIIFDRGGSALGLLFLALKTSLFLNLLIKTIVSANREMKKKIQNKSVSNIFRFVFLYLCPHCFK